MIPRLLVLFSVASLAFGAAPVAAQQTSTDYAWKPLLQEGGVSFTYIYYAKPGSTVDGVVVKVANTNDYAVRYRFKVVFRTDGDERVEEAGGTLAAHEARTGDADGLYWVPFLDGRPIIEFGLRGYEVTRLAEEPPGSTER